MVYQRTALSAQAAARAGRGTRERRNTCLGCDHGLGQFAVEFPADDYNSSGRGYCSLDCYTCAKVMGRATHMPEGRTTNSRYGNQHQQGRGGRDRGYHVEPQPWPTGFLVDAPPSPKPWRGQNRALSSSRRHSHHYGSSSSSGSSSGGGGGSVSWRTGRTSSNGTLSSNEDASSQESSVADWQHGGSEDGESSSTECGGGSGGAAGAGAVSRTRGADEIGRRAGAPKVTPGSGGRAAPSNGGNGGGCAVGVAGGHDGGNNRAREQRLPPLAPIPRVGAFPAQHLVHGGGDDERVAGDGREAELRTTAAAAAAAAASSRPRVTKGAAAAAAVVNASGRETAANNAAASASPGRTRPQGDAGGPLPPTWISGGSSATRRQQDVRRSQEQQQTAVVTKSPTPAAGDAGDGTDTSRQPVTVRGYAPETRLEVHREVDGSTTASTGARGQRELVSCMPVRVVTTKTAVRQWRRMFLP